MKNLAKEPPLAVTIDSAAHLLTVSRRTIYRLAATGRLRIVRITPDAPRIMQADLESFLNDCKAPPAGDYPAAEINE